MRRIILAFLILQLFVFSCEAPIFTQIKFAHKENNYNLLHSENLIEEYTWAVIRYDNPFQPSINFGLIKWPKPSIGTILVVANMLSEKLCEIAAQIYNESKYETLKALVEYDIKNMKHSKPAMIPKYDEWSSPGLRNANRKVATHEMFCLGEKCISPYANIIGDCYSLASFNTALLRLCGFKAEEVFTLLIPPHAVNAVRIDKKWYIIDPTLASNVRLGKLNTILFENYNFSQIYGYKCIFLGLENDRYMVHFGIYDYIEPSSNMNGSLLKEIVESLLPVINNPPLGTKNWLLDDFIETAKPHPEMLNISMPYSVEDVAGNETEKGEKLAKMNLEFVCSIINEDDPSQYSRALYAYNLLDVKYPEAYANAAKYAAWTSWLGVKLDADTAYKDAIRTLRWISLVIKPQRILNDNQVAFSDLTYLMRRGSSIDKAIVAYGMLRNMKKESYMFWNPEDLYVIITENNRGYLAINISGTWYYLDFYEKKIDNEIPYKVKIAFNEEKALYEWL